MEDLLKFLIKPLVTDIKAVKIEKVTSGDHVSFNIKIPKSDIAKVIGKEGKMIKAIKNLVKVRAIKENLFVSLNLEEV